MIREMLRRLVEYPLWAYGLQCNVCKMTFISPKAHYEEAKAQKNMLHHRGITIFKKWR